MQYTYLLLVQKLFGSCKMFCCSVLMDDERTKCYTTLLKMFTNLYSDPIIKYFKTM